MKRSFNCLLLLSCLLACDERTLDTHDPAPGEPTVFEEVNADVSDIEVAREYSFDIHVNGTFDYEENYYYSFNEGFDLTFPFYKASYEAGSMPVISPRVHNSLMCRTNECDSSEMMGSGVWYRYGVKSENNRFVVPAQLVEKVSVSRADTAFINLISMKRVIKVIEDKKVAINYRKNHIYPTTIK